MKGFGATWTCASVENLLADAKYLRFACGVWVALLLFCRLFSMMKEPRLDNNVFLLSSYACAPQLENVSEA